MSSVDSALLGDTNQAAAAVERSKFIHIGLALVGSVLIGAAVAKLVWPADSAKVQAVLDAPPWMWSLLVTTELFVGLLLILGVHSPLTWLVTASLFTVFAGFSIYLAASGITTCGCFGRLNVNPWATFVLDLSILGFLLRWRRQIASPIDLETQIRVNQFAVSSAALAVSLLATATMGFGAFSASSGIEGAIEEGELVILEPDEWIGKPFPLIERISPSVDIAVGQWTVLLYHHDCPKCQEAAPRYEQLAFSSKAPRQVMLLEMPPFAEQPVILGSPAVHARLSERREWFAETPVEITIQDGIVVGSSLDLPSVASQLLSAGE